MLLYQDCEIRRDSLFIHSTRTRIPFSGSFWSDLRKMMLLFTIISLVSAVRRPLKRRGDTPTIGFFPTRPTPWYFIWNVYNFMGLRASANPEECDLFYYFEDTTQAQADTGWRLASGKYVINAGCTDIGKDRVMRVFERVFGYGFEVDPTTHQGPAVCKSTRNAAHDGRIIQCPIEKAEEGHVYQTVIDNSDDGVNVQDIRVPIVGGRIPFVYIKERPKAVRFANENSRVSFHETAEFLSEDETAMLARFAEAMQLEIGSFDVLRDKTSGRIYVVDANKTCMGPPIALNIYDKIRAIRRMGIAVEDFTRRLVTRTTQDHGRDSLRS